MKTAAVVVLVAFVAVAAGLLGGIIYAYFGLPFQNNNAVHGTITGSDAIAVANTFIVFTTLIFVLITVIATGLGIYFVRWFASTKEREIQENMRYFFTELEANSEFASEFAEQLLERETISNALKKLVETYVADILKSQVPETVPVFSFQFKGKEKSTK